MLFPKVLQETGYCPKFDREETINIWYFTPPDRSRKKSDMYLKHNNKCEYLEDGECDKKETCPIYNNAETYKEIYRGKNN